MKPAGPALLVANAKSRRGDQVAPFEAALRAGGLDLRREYCADPSNLPALIHSAADDVSAVLLGGGDGTLHVAAPALYETGLPLGILPLGTANDLARTLSIPSEPKAAAAIIIAGATSAIDLGSVNGIPFFNVASLGLSVVVTKRLDRIMKRRFGMLAYPLAAALTVINSRRFSAALGIDGVETLVTTLQIAVGNGRYYGGGAVVEENADITDSLLNVYSLEPRSRWRLILMARTFRSGAHYGSSEVRSLACRSITVTTKRPHDICADGEIVSQTPAEFGIIEKAIHVFVPSPP